MAPPIASAGSRELTLESLAGEHLPDRAALIKAASNAGSCAITTRQSTYWTFVTAGPTPRTFRVDLAGRLDVSFHSNPVHSLQFIRDHPLTLDWRAPTSSLYFTGRLDDPRSPLAAIESAVCEESAGWRSAARYLNPGAVNALTEGYGLLMAGPAPFVDRATSLAKAAGLVVSSIASPEPSATSTPMSCELLLWDTGWIVARSLRVREITVVA